MGDIMFICGKCGTEVEKEATICHKCGAKLGNIRCPFCKYTGTPLDFKNDHCPKCGRSRNLKINLNKNKIISNKKNKTSIESDFEKDDFISKYFIILFISLLLVTGSILILFLKYFNFI